ncbi:MAG: ASPIC/UnbV domain-containing protein, partial [Planctomycetota bacterium]|nr:ASPIC/UnbV domain-containing protein [Planctomycetota bacterium]
DNDGDIDILVVNRDGPAHLLRNVVAGRGHWIGFRVVEDAREALGAQVVVSIGSRRVTRQVRAAYSYCASNDPRVHFGLGKATRVDGVTVRWPDAGIESFGRYTADQRVTLRRGAGTRVDDPEKTR